MDSESLIVPIVQCLLFYLFSSFSSPLCARFCSKNNILLCHSSKFSKGGKCRKIFSCCCFYCFENESCCIFFCFWVERISTDYLKFNREFDLDFQVLITKVFCGNIGPTL